MFYNGQPIISQVVNSSGVLVSSDTYTYTPELTIEERLSEIETTLIEVVSLLKLIGSVALDRVPEIKAKKEKE